MLEEEFLILKEEKRPEQEELRWITSFFHRHRLEDKKQRSIRTKLTSKHFLNDDKIKKFFRFTVGMIKLTV